LLEIPTVHSNSTSNIHNTHHKNHKVLTLGRENSTRAARGRRLANLCAPGTH